VRVILWARCYPLPPSTFVIVTQPAVGHDENVKAMRLVGDVRYDVGLSVRLSAAIQNDEGETGGCGGAGDQNGSWLSFGPFGTYTVSLPLHPHSADG
jgi:hypothetical protein